MNKDIIEGNTLIAEFMCCQKFEFVDDFDRDLSGVRVNDSVYPFESLEYHSSFDWLIPVIEKISKEFTVNIHSYPSQGFYTVIKEGNFRRGYGENEIAINAIWNAVIEFIKWYNQHKLRIYE